MTITRIELAKLEGIADAKAEKGIHAALLQGEAILKADILSRPGTGELYGKHRASAPGEPPAPDTGELRNKTAADPQLRWDNRGVTGRIVANSEKAAAL
ncbi:MAG: hypothetical protein IV093_21430, partial [Rubrivivax sp.]|nr:hypothetical protein [Rubrivivax sp.]